MLLAGVVGHDVHEDADATPAGLGDQPVEVVHGAEFGRDGAEVRDVVAPVGVGRHGDRREPDAVDAEPGEVVEVLDDARDVPDAVGVAVGERARIDLVEDAGLPPRARRPPSCLRARGAGGGVPPRREVEHRVAGRHPGQRLRRSSRDGPGAGNPSTVSCRSVACCTKRYHDMSSPALGRPCEPSQSVRGRLVGDVHHEPGRSGAPSCARPGGRRRGGRPGSIRPGPRPAPPPRTGRRTPSGSGRSAPPGCAGSGGATPPGSPPSRPSRRSGRRTSRAAGSRARAGAPRACGSRSRRAAAARRSAPPRPYLALSMAW